MKVMERDEVLGALEQVVDTAGAAEVLGVKPGSIVRYRMPDRAGVPFPAPVRVFGDSPVWLRADVEAWRDARPGRGAGGGRPRKQPEHVCQVESRSSRKVGGPVTHRWACSCGDAGRWTRQSDTAATGRDRHVTAAAS